MFYDVYLSLCQKIGKKPTVVAAELGINKSNVSNWKNNGYTPRGEALQRIAEYFHVTTDYLLGKADEKKEPAVQEDDELSVRFMNALFQLTPEQQDLVLGVMEGFLHDKTVPPQEK